MSKLVVISLLLVSLCNLTLQQGEIAYPGALEQFPWFVLFHRVSLPQLPQLALFLDACGGTIIAPTWIISTANCGSPSPPNTTNYRILIGAVEWEDEVNAEQIIETTLFYRHPLFHDHSGNRTNNLGLMQLGTEIQFSARVQAINLPWNLIGDTFAGQELFIVTVLNQNGMCVSTVDRLKKKSLILINSF